MNLNYLRMFGFQGQCFCSNLYLLVNVLIGVFLDTRVLLLCAVLRLRPSFLCGNLIRYLRFNCAICPIKDLFLKTLVS